MGYKSFTALMQGFLVTCIHVVVIITFQYWVRVSGSFWRDWKVVVLEAMDYDSFVPDVVNLEREKS